MNGLSIYPRFLPVPGTGQARDQLGAVVTVDDQTTGFVAVMGVFDSGEDLGDLFGDERADFRAAKRRRTARYRAMLSASPNAARTSMSWATHTSGKRPSYTAQLAAPEVGGVGHLEEHVRQRIS